MALEDRPGRGGCRPCLPWKKWLKATSYSVAAEAKVEMCPPMPLLSLFARTTIAMAFQRMMLLTRAFDLAVARVCGLEFDRNGVDIRRGALEAKGTPMRKARSRSFSNKYCAQFPPLRPADEVERLQPFRRFLGIIIPLQNGHDARD